LQPLLETRDFPAPKAHQAEKSKASSIHDFRDNGLTNIRGCEDWLKYTFDHGGPLSYSDSNCGEAQINLSIDSAFAWNSSSHKKDVSQSTVKNDIAEVQKAFLS